MSSTSSGEEESLEESLEESSSSSEISSSEESPYRRRDAYVSTENNVKVGLNEESLVRFSIKPFCSKKWMVCVETKGDWNAAVHSTRMISGDAWVKAHSTSTTEPMNIPVPRELKGCMRVCERQAFLHNGDFYA